MLELFRCLSCVSIRTLLIDCFRELEKKIDSGGRSCWSTTWKLVVTNHPKRLRQCIIWILNRSAMRKTWWLRRKTQPSGNFIVVIGCCDSVLTLLTDEVIGVGVKDLSFYFSNSLDSRISFLRNFSLICPKFLCVKLPEVKSSLYVFMRRNIDLKQTWDPLT